MRELLELFFAKNDDSHIGLSAIRATEAESTYQPTSVEYEDEPSLGWLNMANNSY